jgi:hypothetical protein
VLAQLGGTSGSCRSFSGFQVLDIFVNLLLQLPELLQGTFGEHGKVAGSVGSRSGLKASSVYGSRARSRDTELREPKAVDGEPCIPPLTDWLE